MVEVVVLGTIALDSVETPFGKVNRALGGSASYAAVAASLFAKPGIVSIIGSDFPKEHMRFFESRGIDLAGVKRAEGKTFHWKGRYGFDINTAETLETKLNVVENFEPRIPEEYREADCLFLGNFEPRVQKSVLEQMKKRPRVVVSDTMNYYIEKNREEVLEMIRLSDIALMNEGEARQLFKTTSLIKAAREILKLDSELAIIKKGEHGCIFLTHESFFSAAGYPLENVIDPTGAGDSFAGALTGYLAKTHSMSEENIRKGIVYASSVASYNAEGFSLERLKDISREDINKRFCEFKRIMEF
jgi:ribokinase